MKILAYMNDQPGISTVLNIGTTLSERLDGEITFLTVRAGTPATEEPPPIGVKVYLRQGSELQPGIQILTEAMGQLQETGFLAPQESIHIRAVRNGYLFLGSTASGRRVPFYERYGHLVDTLNYEVDEQQQDLVIAAAPRRSRLGRFMAGDKARQLALDLHSSILLVRGGNMDSRFLVCADGSPSARRLFPLLKKLLPAIGGPVDLIYVCNPGATEEEKRAGSECAHKARVWLGSCGKEGDLLLPEGDRPEDSILEAAGVDSVVVMGASLRHDVHHRVRGSLPLKVLAKTGSSLLLAKLPPEVDTDSFQEFENCWV
jgi:nucleotide-binding universal stress UspA family protein